MSTATTATHRRPPLAHTAAALRVCPTVCATAPRSAAAATGSAKPLASSAAAAAGETAPWCPCPCCEVPLPGDGVPPAGAADGGR